MWRMPERCPTCRGALDIRELSCAECGTEIRGRFNPCDFCRLTQEQATFLRVFVLSRGNLKSVGRELGISYPTVSSKLEEIIGALRGESQGGARPEASATRRQILDRIARGELPVAEGLGLLKALTPEEEAEEDG